MAHIKKSKTKVKDEAEITRVRKPRFRIVKGMKDILPEEQPYWELLRDTVKKFAFEYGFRRIDTPILEDTNVFVRSVGRGTDIVDKEMFSFKDKGGDGLSLRPENTAGICRAYVEHGMVNKPQPVKLYYFAPMFRYDQPQTGRQRQFYQFGFEILGSSSPSSDAQMILVAANILKALGLKDLKIQVNSVGCASCQPDFKDTLINYYQGQVSRLCPNCKKRLKTNPLRLLDCKEEKCQRLANNAPALIDSLCSECHDHLKGVLEHLDELDIPYNLNSKLVRGLDYYTKTVFEIWPNDKSTVEGLAQFALGGGGRYDNLISELGGSELGGEPSGAVGFSCGVERVINRMVESNIKPPATRRPAVFLAQLGELARRRVLVIFEELRQNGILVAESFSRGSLKSQLKVADRLGVKLTLILGQKEALEETILFRDMETGVQELVSRDKILIEVKKRIAKMKVKKRNV